MYANGIWDKKVKSIGVSKDKGSQNGGAVVVI